MDMDLSQFFQMFFEESLEALDDIEKTLLNINVSEYSDDEINLIFRCMHSIKGGGATFGFTDISEFTHTVETFMDHVRNKTTVLTAETVNLLLKVIDASRAMILKHQGDENQDISHVTGIHEAFKLLNDSVKNGKNDIKLDNKTSQSSWYIYFKPHPKMVQKGNEPLRMLNELKNLGSCLIAADTSFVPSWGKINPEQSYLAWHIYVKTEKSEQDITTDIFDWVIDECALIFKAVEVELQTKTDLLQFVHALKNPQAASAIAPAVEPSPEVSPILHETSSEKDHIASKTAPSKEAASIRVATDKVDAMINLVGELVITQAILQQLINNTGVLTQDSRLKECLSQFAQNIRELQESAMIIRMLPISNIFNRFPRMVRDLTQSIGKKVELKLSGETTELDKTVMEKIGDPLVHLVRNSLDHGIENAQTRLEKGKPETGVLHLNAYHQSSNIIIDVSDDGNGLNTTKIRQKAIEKGLIAADAQLSDDEINALIFLPGFSTADTVTDLSGRGVGMDVVKKNIQMVGGTINVSSTPGQGSTFSICLPLTLSIIDGQILKVAHQTFILPLNAILEIIQIKEQFVSCVSEDQEVYFLRNKYIPIVHLSDIFELKTDKESLEDRFLIIIEVNHIYYGIVIDDLLAQQQIVIKNIEHNYKHIDGIVGATVLGDGTVTLILDVIALVQLAARKKSRGHQPMALT